MLLIREGTGMIELSEVRLGIIGLGYVGLPLAVEFGRTRCVVGFDINKERIEELHRSYDHTGELTSEELTTAKYLHFTTRVEDLNDCNCYIVAVPTPIDIYKCPDFGPLIEASVCVGKLLKPNDIVIFESTVYPGATEEVCVPILEKFSGLKYITTPNRTANLDSDLESIPITVPNASQLDNNGFYGGYSPERINPGDRIHRITTIKKVTSGSTPEAANLVDSLYREIITAGTHRAPSIRVAEAAKVIENTQRDLNIALINELSIIFNKLGIDTESVLLAAGSKWNFLPFRPGLVGGHCIGVDPYYLTHMAKAIGYHPELILAGRRLNDGMGAYVASQLIKAMTRKGIPVAGARVLIMGLTFKEDCPDIRNTQVVGLVNELENYSCIVDIHDPWVSSDVAEGEYGLTLISVLEPNAYDAIVLAVAHRQFVEMGAVTIRNLGRPSHIIYDLKYILAVDETDLRL